MVYLIYRLPPDGDEEENGTKREENSDLPYEGPEV